MIDWLTSSSSPFFTPCIFDYVHLTRCPLLSSFKPQISFVINSIKLNYPSSATEQGILMDSRDSREITLLPIFPNRDSLTVQGGDID